MAPARAAPAWAVLLLAARLMVPVTAQTVVCADIVEAPAVEINEFTPVGYQTAHWSFGFGPGVDASAFEACLSHWEFRYRNIEDYDYLDNPTEDTKIWWATLLLPPATRDYAAVVSIPGLIMEGAVRPVFDNDLAGGWTAVEVTSGMSPIWEEGFDANTAGVGQDEECPSNEVLYSSRHRVQVGAVNMSDPIDEIVVSRGETMILDASTPRILVLKVFGCLTWMDDAEGLELTADSILVAGKFLVGSEDAPFEHKATITLTGHRPEETADEERSNKFLYPANCDQEIESGSYTGCDYTAEWTFEGDPAEIGTTVRFELCTAASDVSDGLGFWAGIGFSSDASMVNSDMLVCQFQQDGSLEPLDAWSTGYVRPEQDYDCNDGVGCRGDVEVISYGTEDGRFYCCTVRREMFTQDDLDVDLSTEMHLLYAKGRLDEDDVMKFHTYFEVSESLLLSEGAAASASDEFYGIIGTKNLVIYGGGTLEMRGAEYTSWTVLDAEARRGSTSVTVANPVQNWQAGDKVYIAPSGWKDNRDNDQGLGDLMTVASVSGDGRTVTFTAPMSNHHYGTVRYLEDDRGRLWDYDVRAEIGNLNRNIVVRGDETSPETKLGGHTLYLRGSLIKIEYVEYARMGQLDTLSRYPVHFHLYGDASRNVVRGLSIHNTFFRSLTMHGVQRLTVEDVFIYQAHDRNLWFEEGSETENVLRHNWVHGGREGIWFENPYNDVIDCAFTGVEVCFDYPIDDGNPPAVDFGTFKNDPRLHGLNTVNGMIIPVGSKRVIGTATWPFGRNQGNTCHTATRVYDQWRHMYSCHERFVWQCGWDTSPMMTHNYIGLTVYKMRLSGGGYFSGYNRYTDNRWADMCAALRSGGGKPGADWVRDETRGLYNSRTVWERSAFVYDANLDIGSRSSHKCRYGAWSHDASMFRVNSAWYWGDSFISGDSPDGEHRAALEVFTSGVGKGMRRMIASGTALGPETRLMIGRADQGVDTPSRDPFGIIDLEGVLAAQFLGYESGPFGAGSHIMPYVPSMHDPLACVRSPVQNTLTVCHPNVSFEFFEVIVGRSDSTTARRQSLRYDRSLNPGWFELHAHEGGSATDTRYNQFWRYTLYFPINGPGTRYTVAEDNPSRVMTAGTEENDNIHQLTFIDALKFTDTLQEAETCDVSPGYIEVIAGGNWWPSDRQIRHRYRVKIRGYGRYPAISPVIPASAFPDGPVLSQSTGYSLTRDGYGVITYDPDTRFLSFELSYPATQFGFSLAYGSGAVYDKEACIEAKGTTEWALLPSTWKPNNRYSITWAPEGTDSIRITITADTGGWAAIGIAADPGTMAPADVMMCSYLNDGTGYISDRRNLDVGDAPVEDDQQDLTLLDIKQHSISTGSETACTFTRKLDTGDEDDQPFAVGNLNVVWAIGADDDDVRADRQPSKHILAGYEELNFYTQVFVDEGGRRHLRNGDGDFESLEDREDVLFVKDIRSPRISSEGAGARSAAVPQAPAVAAQRRQRLRAQSPEPLPSAPHTEGTNLVADVGGRAELTAARRAHDGQHRQLIDQDTASDTRKILCDKDNTGVFDYCALDLWSVYQDHLYKCWNYGCQAPAAEYTGMSLMSTATFEDAPASSIPNFDGATRPPTARPTPRPTRAPTTRSPTRSPSPQPTRRPTTPSPTKVPTPSPTQSPTEDGSTRAPTPRPTTGAPTFGPKLAVTGSADVDLGGEVAQDTDVLEVFKGGMDKALCMSAGLFSSLTGCDGTVESQFVANAATQRGTGRRLTELAYSYTLLFEPEDAVYRGVATSPDTALPEVASLAASILVNRPTRFLRFVGDFVRGDIAARGGAIGAGSSFTADDVAPVVEAADETFRATMEEIVVIDDGDTTEDSADDTTDGDGSAPEDDGAIPFTDDDDFFDDAPDDEGGSAEGGGGAAATDMAMMGGAAVGGALLMAAIGYVYILHRRSKKQKGAFQTKKGAFRKVPQRDGGDIGRPPSPQVFGTNPIFRPRSSTNMTEEMITSVGAHTKSASVSSLDSVDGSVKRAAPAGRPTSRLGLMAAVSGMRTSTAEGQAVAGAPDWYAFLDEHRNVYYYNIRTGVSSWTRPASESPEKPTGKKKGTALKVAATRLGSSSHPRRKSLTPVEAEEAKDASHAAFSASPRTSTFLDRLKKGATSTPTRTAPAPPARTAPAAQRWSPVQMTTTVTSPASPDAASPPAPPGLTPPASLAPPGLTPPARRPPPPRKWPVVQTGPPSAPGYSADRAPSFVNAYEERRRSVSQPEELVPSAASAAVPRTLSVRDKAAALNAQSNSNTAPTFGTAGRRKSVAKQLLHAGRAVTAAVTGGATGGRGASLPVGWQALRDDQGRTYFYHAATQKSQWNRPAAQNTVAVANANHGLPSGWEAVHDAAGRVYYHHPDSGRTQWENP